MKRFLSILIPGVFSCVNLFGLPQQELDMRDYIRKYGKPGDDTEAFRQAMQEIGRKNLRYLYIPPGSYHLTDTIDLSALSNGEIHGAGYPEISMKDGSKDIFTSNYAWKLKIDGLSFRGGRNHLVLKNNNIDRTNIIIANCKFQNAGEFAIRFDPKMFSAHVLIDSCSFYSNRQALQSVGDWVRLSNSWITTSPEMQDQAAIVNYGCLTIDHILGVPLVKKPLEKTKQRWIDNYGLKLTCRDTRFGGEDGGLPIIYNFRTFRWKNPIVASAILLSDCWLYCAGTQAIRFFEVPNKVIVESCTGLCDAKMFTFEKTADLNYLKENPAKTGTLITIRVNDTEATFPSILPALLKDVGFGKKIQFTNEMK